MNQYQVIIDGEYTEGRELFIEDKLPYAVLYTVLGGKVKKIITNRKDFIIAHTATVYPTWIWVPDDCSVEHMEMIYQIIMKEFEPLKEYRFNTKYEIAAFLMRRFKEDHHCEFRISTNIVAYECKTPVAPTNRMDGHLTCLNTADYDLAVNMVEVASIAIGDRIMSHAESMDAAKELLQKQALYIWQNESGKVVSFCEKIADDDYVKLSQVYTPREERGKGYAAWMIYELCREIQKYKQTAMLYADADYSSSNRCYQKIGFESKGKIVTIESIREEESL